jgi:hypothetical protein
MVTKNKWFFKRGDFLKEVQFIWNFLWQYKKTRGSEYKKWTSSYINMFYRQTCALLWALSFACGQICDYILSLDYDTDLGDKNMHRIFPRRPLLYQILRDSISFTTKTRLPQ